MAVPNFEPADRRSAPLRLRLLSDERLARRAENGDQHAVEAILERYQQDLYRFCLAMTGDPMDAEAALQVTLTRARRGLAEGERQLRLKPWLYRIARNETVDSLPRPHESDALKPEQHHLLVDLEQLPRRQRAVLVMRELSGLDFTQIGAAFGISPTAALEAVYEARLKLRQLQEGRELRCAKVMWELSEVDGRASRRRKVRAHLRECAECRAFRDEIAFRRGGLAALPPLPLAGGSSGLAGLVAALAGEAAGTSVAVKVTATVAVMAVTGIGVAERDIWIEPERPSKAGVGSARSEPSTRPLPLAAGNTTSAVAARQSVAEPETSAYVPSAEQPSAPHEARALTASPGGGSPVSEVEPRSPEVDQSQLTTHLHEDVEAPPEEPALEPFEAAAGETPAPAPPASAEAAEESAVEQPDADPELPATPATPPTEAETPATPPTPPAFDGGTPRRPGDWHRGRNRPRSRR